MDTQTVDTLKHLVETVENGQRGFADGAAKLAKDGNPVMAATFTELGHERAMFASELRSLHPEMFQLDDAMGTVPGAVHRGWLALKDALTGDNPHAVLDVAEQGEDHALKAFATALDSDLPDAVRAVVSRQSAEIQAAHDTVKALRDRN